MQTSSETSENVALRQSLTHHKDNFPNAHSVRVSLKVDTFVIASHILCICRLSTFRGAFVCIISLFHFVSSLEAMFVGYVYALWVLFS